MAEQQHYAQNKLREAKLIVHEVLTRAKDVKPQEDVALIVGDLERVIGILNFWEETKDE